MADAIQKGIEAAQQDLVKESEEKLLEEVQISCSPNKQTSTNEKSVQLKFLSPQEHFLTL